MYPTKKWKRTLHIFLLNSHAYRRTSLQVQSFQTWLELADHPKGGFVSLFLFLPFCRITSIATNSPDAPKVRELHEYPQNFSIKKSNCMKSVSPLHCLETDSYIVIRTNDCSHKRTTHVRSLVMGLRSHTGSHLPIHMSLSHSFQQRAKHLLCFPN